MPQNHGGLCGVLFRVLCVRVVCHLLCLFFLCFCIHVCGWVEVGGRLGGERLSTADLGKVPHRSRHTAYGSCWLGVGHQPLWILASGSE